jgi:hypothetical protein
MREEWHLEKFVSWGLRIHPSELNEIMTGLKIPNVSEFIQYRKTVKNMLRVWLLTILKKWWADAL